MLRRVAFILVTISTLLFVHITWNGANVASSKKKVHYPKHTENSNNTLMWVVNIKHNNQDSMNHDISADQIAMDLDLENLGNVGHVENNYLFAWKFNHALKTGNESLSTPKRTISLLHKHYMEIYNAMKITELITEIEEKLHSHNGVNWYTHQKILVRNRRSWMPFTDPFYKKQWHLTNTLTRDMDINITDVWRHNITGAGVTVAVVDDGLEWNNPDLEANYNKAGSWDFNDNDNDPMPDGAKESNHHGTRCAGEISALPNDVCGVGVAYGAQISGLRILDGPMTDSLEASAFTKNFQINDIYSCSWGPEDDGKTVDGPHVLAAAAMKHGIDFGRHGYGSIYVVASGNGGQNGDNCNYDGYANSIYTVTIGAVDETGHMPFYSEECASMLAVTFSSGGGYTRQIVTTDWTARITSSRDGCTEHHTGTSAAAPIAAALIALMLQVQPCLTWRDIQYLIILTAQKVDIDVAHWQKNGAGLWHSHKHGFGLMKAWRLANAARVWNQVPWQTSYLYKQENIDLQITKGKDNPLQVKYTVTEEEANEFDLYVLESVQVTLTLDHPSRGHLEVKLHSPHGTRSVIGASRPHDNSSAGFDKWTFTTVRCWGETPAGTWVLTITDTDASGNYGYGTLRSWSLKLFGTPMSPKEFRIRRRAIENAMHGQLLNHSSVCIPPPVTSKPDNIMSVKTLKVVILICAFCLIMAVYESLESLLCFNEEKKEHSKLVTLTRRAHKMAGLYYSAERQLNSDSHPSERTGLLSESEDIPMETFQPSNDLERSEGQNDWLTIERSPNDLDPETVDSERLRTRFAETEFNCESNQTEDNLPHETSVGGMFNTNQFHFHGNQNISTANNSESIVRNGDNLVKTDNGVMNGAKISKPSRDNQSCDRNQGQGHSVPGVRVKHTNHKTISKSGYTLLNNDSGESEDDFG